ncbi:hypothetical protein [Streptomyces sp. AK08-02]|uniref:hypothetical protein n=1 Tax=Streptomyces sp. AK08-02 TaxID=3028654 RepID=UPI0029A2551F|nr:hypothetical protein [Streptomyces sp. AK08-02]MDX3748693.1 hypothetical protein [Streptomyces sp. AK08-02]
MPQPHERLDKAMSARRLELRLNWRELARDAQISYEALRAIRKGDYRPAELTARTLDEALQWAPGSVYAILDGGEAVTVEMQTAIDRAASEYADSRAAAREAEARQTAPTLDQELELAARLMAAQIRELGLSPADAEEAWRRAYHKIVQAHVPANPLEAHPETPPHHQAG